MLIYDEWFSALTPIISVYLMKGFPYFFILKPSIRPMTKVIIKTIVRAKNKPLIFVGCLLNAQMSDVDNSIKSLKF